jgi:hypothetical protein
MPAIADIVANFHELQAAYEEETGQSKQSNLIRETLFFYSKLYASVH